MIKMRMNPHCAFLLVTAMLATEAVYSPRNRPTTITSEFETLVVSLPYDTLITGMEKAKKYLRDLKSHNYRITIGLQRNSKQCQGCQIIIDQKIIVSMTERLDEVFRQLGRLGVIESSTSRQKRALEGDIAKGALDGASPYGSTNIFQDAIGSIGEVLGFGSLKRFKVLQHHINYVAQHIYEDQEKLTSRLGKLASDVADTVSQLDKEIKNVINVLENDDEKRHSLLHMITSVVDQSVRAVSLFNEIRDRADLGLPSVTTVSEATLRAFIKNTTDRNRDLRAIYPNVRSYFQLPYAETSVNIQARKFTTVLKIPFVRKIEHFYPSEKHLSYVRMTSEDNHIFLSHQESLDCHKTTKDVVCITRPCRVTKYEDALKSCIVTKSETNMDDVVELVYDPEYLQKNPVNEKITVLCKGGRRKEMPVSKDVIQIRLPPSCSMKNQYFEIDEVITSAIPPNYLQDNEISLNFIEVSINETEEDFSSSVTINSPATVQIVEHLRQEAKYAVQLRQTQIQHAEEIDKSNQNVDFYVSTNYIYIGLVASVIFFVLVLFFCLYFQCCCQLLKCK